MTKKKLAITHTHSFSIALFSGHLHFHLSFTFTTMHESERPAKNGDSATVGYIVDSGCICWSSAPVYYCEHKQRRSPENEATFSTR